MSRSAEAGRRTGAFALMALAAALPAAAEVPLARFTEVLDGLAGTEVALDGFLGTGLDVTDDEAFFFMLPDRRVFPVVFDAGREARAALAGCVFETFGGGTPCRVTGAGELGWDGSRLRVIVFRLDTQEPPAPLP